MSFARKVLASSDHLPINTDQPVHSGKVRSVYWLTSADSQRIISENSYDLAPNTQLGLMIISDRISAFECLWKSEDGTTGVPGKGAAINAISSHWFDCFKEAGLADSHIVDTPHPLVWLVQRAEPVMIEAIARSYITGSMWRSYSKGARNFCGIALPDGLSKDQQLEELLITPSTKGVISGVIGVPEVDDVNVDRATLEANFSRFKFDSVDDIALYEKLLADGFQLISDHLSGVGQIFVDTKFEFGYVSDARGNRKLIYMDEVGTPDSSRMWDAVEYENGRIVENSKEVFRKLLLNHFDDSDVLLDKDRMDERIQLAEDTYLPQSYMEEVSRTYIDIAEKITGKPLSLTDCPEQDIIDVLNDKFSLIK